ncbi:MAG: GGDEF domain-containing protein [Vulcanimicrobiaceae bacterium]
MEQQMPKPSLEAHVESAVLCARRNGTVCALIVLDLDRFGQINERFGEFGGDELLDAVETRLIKHVRATDVVARVAGNTFAIVVNGVRDCKDAARTARVIARSFELPFPFGSLDIRLRASIGVATFPYAAATASELLQIALQKMFLVKHHGGYGILNAPSREETAARSDENRVSRPAASSAAERHLRIVRSD